MRKKAKECAHCLPIKRCVFQAKSIKKEEIIGVRSLLAKLETSANSFGNSIQPHNPSFLNKKCKTTSGEVDAIIKNFETETLH